MRKAYLIVFNTSFADLKAITDTLNVCHTVITWRYDLSNAIYVVSEESANAIAKELETHLGSRGRYIVLEYTDNSQGRLTAESWYLLNKKYRKSE
jgi:hypothetical protein